MTRRELKERFTHILNGGYCSHYKFENNERFVIDKIGSNAGVYGWNWSAYYIYDKKNDFRFILLDSYRNAFTYWLRDGKNLLAEYEQIIRG